MENLLSILEGLLFGNGDRLPTILIGWVMTPDYVIDEMQRNGETFRRKKLYRVMIRYVAPVMMLVLFLQSTGILA